ncbi:MYXO-CTERM sorting domain-containing protein, partial [Archangium sp.]|uniref:MYXO-CTERM sorting domain-containing protein n=1 Tax=Archangium sp. TaxID=1872627 RepID=UPI002EDB923B
LSDVPFTWSASPSAGTINAAGVFTASCSPGNYYSAITAVSPNGLSANAGVTIETGPAAQVVISPASAKVGAGATHFFSASVRDSCGNYRSDSVTWSTVSGSGTITGSGDYTATCTSGVYPGAVIASAGSLSASAEVTVSPGQPTKLTISPRTASVPAGGQVTFSAVATDNCGNTLSPSSLSWSLSYGGSGSISSSGVFTAGTRATSYPDTVQVSVGWSLSASASVEVTPGPVARVTLSPSRPSLPMGSTVQFTARAEDAYGNERPSRPRLWSAEASAGSITATGLFTAGTTPGLYSGAVQVEVDGVKASTDVVLTPRVARVEVSRVGSAPVAAGGSATFQARAFDSWGTEVKDVSFAWSARSAVGAIDSSGKLTVSCVPGTVASGVTATASGVSGSADVTIAPGAAVHLAVVPSTVTLVAGGSTSFKAWGMDTCGNALSPSVGWQVVAGGGSVNAAGLFTAGTRAGFWPQTVRISSGSLSALANVLVIPGPTARVELSPLAPSVRAGASVQLTARALDAHGNERPARAQWASEAAAGSVTEEGLFTAGTTAGEFANAVTATVDGVSASTSVRVLSSTDGGSEPEPRDPPPRGGFGCTSTSDGSAPLAALLLLGLLMTRRRLFPL